MHRHALTGRRVRYFPGEKERIEAALEVERGSPEETTLLFGYGTLMPGYRPPQAFQEYKAVRVKGRIFQHECGRFPCAINLGRDDSTVKGFVFRIPNWVMTQIDRREGVSVGLYARRLVTPEGWGEEVWAYEYARTVRNLYRIRSGEWRPRMKVGVHGLDQTITAEDEIDLLKKMKALSFDQEMTLAEYMETLAERTGEHEDAQIKVEGDSQEERAKNLVSRLADEGLLIILE